MADLTHKRILAIALPIVLSNATVPILGAVDTGVVGQLGDPVPIGAVGIGATILTAFYWIVGFLRMGTTGLTSQAEGAGDRAEVSALLTRGLLLGLAFGVILILFQSPLFALGFAVSPASAEVESLARDYMQIRVWSAPANIALYAVTGWLIALERTRGVLLLQIWMNSLNIILDLWFVLGLNWGVQGVAFATLIAETSGLALGLWLCRDGFADGTWRKIERIFDIVRLRRMAAVNTDILIRTLALQTIMVSFLFWGADFGDVPLAANQVLLQFLHITAFALDGFAFAVETLVGKAVGAKNRALLRRSALWSSYWAFGVALALALVFALLGGALIDLMTTAPEVREEARRYLIFMALCPIFGIPAWMLDGIFIGATRSRDMRNMMLISTALYIAAALPLIAAFENHGLWIAMLVSYVARGATLGWRYPALERDLT